jgi:hypothetical protein
MKIIQEVSVVHTDLDNGGMRAMARWKQYGIQLLRNSGVS